MVCERLRSPARDACNARRAGARRRAIGAPPAPAFVESSSETLATGIDATRALRRSSRAPAARSSFRARKRAPPSQGVGRPLRTICERGLRPGTDDRNPRPMQARGRWRGGRLELVYSERLASLDPDACFEAKRNCRGARYMPRAQRVGRRILTRLGQDRTDGRASAASRYACPSTADLCRGGGELAGLPQLAECAFRSPRSSVAAK
jgi:hypothetical protein